jgi:uncharacterized protein YjbI with pentapeptide repeats
LIVTPLSPILWPAKKEAIEMAPEQDNTITVSAARRLRTLLAIVAALVLLWMLWQTYRAGNLGFAYRTLWEWLELLVVPLALALAAFWFSRIQKRTELEIAEKVRELDLEIAFHEARQAQNKQEQAILENYLEQMKDLVLDRGLGPDARPEVQGLARAWTLSVLRELTSAYNRQVIHFLQDTHLLGPHSGVDLRNADLSKSQLGKSNLSGANLEGANLSGANLERANLEGAYLNGAVLKGANLEGANLKGANLNDAHLAYAVLTHANLEGANLHRGNLESAGLEEAYLQGADLSDAHLSSASLTRANLKGADLTGAELDRARLRGANLKGANLKGAILSGANLQGASLEGANLEKASMWGVDLSDADLSGALLTEASLVGSKLEGANLENAGLEGTGLQMAHLSRARGVTESQLGKAKLSKDTVIPDGRFYREWQRDQVQATAEETVAVADPVSEDSTAPEVKEPRLGPEPATGDGPLPQTAAAGGDAQPDAPR